MLRTHLQRPFWLLYAEGFEGNKKGREMHLNAPVAPKDSRNLNLFLWAWLNVILYLLCVIESLSQPWAVDVRTTHPTRVGIAGRG